jgi:hypothetical protein
MFGCFSPLASSVLNTGSHQQSHQYPQHTTPENLIWSTPNFEGDLALDLGSDLDAPEMYMDTVSITREMHGNVKPKESGKSANFPSYGSSTGGLKGFRQRRAERNASGPEKSRNSFQRGPIESPSNGMKSLGSLTSTKSTKPRFCGDSDNPQKFDNVMFNPSQALHIRTNSASKTESDLINMSTSASPSFNGGPSDCALDMDTNTIFKATYEHIRLEDLAKPSWPSSDGASNQNTKSARPTTRLHGRHRRSAIRDEVTESPNTWGSVTAASEYGKNGARAGYQCKNCLSY